MSVKSDLQKQNVCLVFKLLIIGAFEETLMYSGTIEREMTNSDVQY